MLLTNWLTTVNKETRRRNSRNVLRSKQIPVASHVEVLEDRTLLTATLIESRVVTELTSLDSNGEVATLPNSEIFIDEWDIFFVELWVSTSATDQGVTSASVDFQYNTEFVTAIDVTFGPAFDDDLTVEIDDLIGLITDISGTANRDDVAADNFALLAVIEIIPDSLVGIPLQPAERDIGPYDLQIILLDTSIELVDDGSVITRTGLPPGTELFAVPYDFNDDARIDFGDFSIFADVFRQNVETSKSEFAWLSDFNKDGVITFGDFSLFAANFRQTLENEADIVFPGTFPSAWRSAPKPLIIAALAGDTAPGVNLNSDGITSDPTIIGIASDNRVITSLEARLGGNFFDIDFDPGDGAFQIDENKLAELNGGPLEEGPFALQIRAEDELGIETLTSVAFTLDTISPTASIIPAGILNQSFSSFAMSFDEPITDAAFVPDNYMLKVVGGLNDGQAINVAGIDQIDDNTANVLFNSSLPDENFRFEIDPRVSDIAGNTLQGMTTFDFTVDLPTTISSLSPSDGEEMVNVTRETIVRFNDPVDPATVTVSSFFAIANGVPLPGRVVVSSTERFATLFYDNPLPASTEVRIVVDGDMLIGRDGHNLDANGDGQAGGQLTAEFRTLPLTRIEGTNVFGFVRDSFSEEPIVGATIRVDAFPSANVVTDENGRFELMNMPAPEFFVHVDGSTATNIPAGFTYPNVGKPFHSVPGQTVQLNHHGDVFDVFLPSLALADIQPLSPTEITEVGFGAAGLAALAGLFPQVPVEVWQRTAVTIEPGTAVDDFQNPAVQAVIIPVPPDRIPAPLPDHFDPKLVISIQTVGATNFDVPAPITFPNLDNLAPGDKAAIFSFNHDAGRWDAVGTGTVSSDGLMIESDPGVGILAPGWHFAAPPFSLIGGDGRPTFVPLDDDPDVEVRPLRVGDPNGDLDFRFELIAGFEELVVIDIDVQGSSFDSFYDNSGDNGLISESITLMPGDAAVQRSARLRSISDIIARDNSGKPFNIDVLYGAKITIDRTAIRTDGSVSRTQKIITPYLFLNQSGSASITFPDTVITGNVSSSRRLVKRVGGAPNPTFVFSGVNAADFSGSGTELVYNPSAAGQSIAGLKFSVITGGVTATSAQSIALRGKGAEKQKLFIDTEEMILALEDLEIEFGIRSRYTNTGAAHTYTLKFAGAETVPIRHNSPAATIEAALEALPTIGAGNVSVRIFKFFLSDMNSVGNVFYEVEALGALEGTANVLTGLSSSADPKTNLSVITRISKDEIELIDTDEKREAFALSVKERVVDLFAPFSDGIEVVDDVGTGANTITMLWEETDQDGLLGLSKPGPDDDGIDNANDIVRDVLTKIFILTPAALATRLDQAINQNFTTDVAVYLDTYFEKYILATRIASLQELANDVANSVAHEAGHTLGGVHTQKGTKVVINNGVSGATDVMSNELDFEGDNAFLNSLTSEILRLALNLGWTPEQAKLALGVYKENVRLGRGLFRSEDENDGDPSETSIPGPLMFISDENGFSVESVIDVGAVLADGAGSEVSQTTLTIYSAGDEAVVIDNISVNGGSGVFTTTPVSDETIDPGEEFSFEITFDPTIVGESSATLVIQSNDQTVPLFELDLSGFGIAIEPRLHLELSSQVNNFGGVELGSLGDTQYVITAINHGIAPLTITPTTIDGIADFSLGSLEGVEQTLAFGEELQILLDFGPSDLGLRRGAIELTTNDPGQDVVVRSVVGTGIPVEGIGLDDFDWGSDFAFLDVRGLTQRTVTNFKGGFDFNLPAGAEFDLSLFDPVSGLIASSMAFSGPAGSRRDVASSLRFEASTAADDDGDGLPNDIERTIGSSISNIDSDGDGLDDFAEIAAGLNPLDGFAFPTGVVGRLALAGEAQRVVVEGNLNDDGQTAYIATGSHGLSIVDVSQFDRPVLIAQRDLPGRAVDVAFDPSLRRVAVTTETGVEIIDVSIPSQPSNLVSIDLAATSVEIIEGVAYVAVGSRLHSIDMVTGEVVVEVSLGGDAITDIAIDGGLLYTMNTGGLMQIVAPVGFDFVPRGSVALPDAGGRLFVGGGVAYAAAAATIVQGGFSTADVSDPDHPRLLSGSDVQGGAVGTAVVANGSGLGLIVGVAATVMGDPPLLQLVDVTDPTLTFEFSRQFGLPGTPLDIALGQGAAFIASGNAGLTTVNYLPFDTVGAPPTVTITTPLEDANPAREGFQLIEGTTLPITAEVLDDVQVSRVQLLVDGVVVRDDVAFPWDLSFAAPTGIEGTTFELQVRAIDTGGNEALSNVLQLEVVDDTVAPQVASQFPAAGGSSFEGLRAVRIAFSESLAEQTVTLDNFFLRDSQSNVLQPSDLRLLQDDRFVKLTFDPLAVDDYELVINGAAVTDRAGNPLAVGEVVSVFTIEKPRSTLDLFDGRLLTTDREPQDVATADLNGDGFLDLVSANKNSHTISVLLGEGGGLFAPHDIYPVGNTQFFNAFPFAVALGDVDKDGKIDAVTANSGSSSFSFLKGDGDGGFAAPQDIALGFTGPNDILLVDLNNDTQLDAVVSHGTRASILLGNGNGTFATPTLLSIGSNVNGIEVGKINDDTVLDLVFASNTIFSVPKRNGIVVFLGVGDGTFGSPLSVEVSEFENVSLADLDGDDKLDVVGAQDRAVGILLGNGDGTFGALIETEVDGSTTFALAGHFDGDLQIDVIAVSSRSGKANVAFLPGNGDGTLGTDVRVPVGGNPHFATAADLNNDGTLDVVAVRKHSNRIIPLLNDGEGSFRARPADTPAPSFKDIIVAELDGDGVQYAVLQGFPPSVWPINSDGTLGTATTLPVTRTPRSIAVADVNRDNKLDIVVSEIKSSNPRVRTVVVHINNGGGSFTTLPGFIGPQGEGAIALADLNGNGTPELIVANTDNSIIESDSLIVLPGNGDGTFGTGTSYPMPRFSFSGSGYIAFGDVNNDDKLDVVTNVRTVSTQGIAFFPGNGDGTLGTRIDTALDSNFDGLAVADFDGDMNLDVAALSGRLGNDGGILKILAGNGDGTFDAPLDILVGFAPTELAAADINGDGAIDLVSVNLGSTSDSVSVVLGDGQGGFELARDYIVGSQPFSLAIADINNDNALDIIVPNTGSVRSITTLLQLTEETATPPTADTQAVKVAHVDAQQASAQASAEVEDNTDGGRLGNVVSNTLLQLIVDQAIARWGLAGAVIDRLESVDIKIDNLGDSLLGLASSDTIWIDDDAAGFGWFVDVTPNTDEEFANGAAIAGSGADGYVDLLTVIIHEYGHVLRFGHTADGVMHSRLAPGMRQVPEPSNFNSNGYVPVFQTLSAATASDYELDSGMEIAGIGLPIFGLDQEVLRLNRFAVPMEFAENRRHRMVVENRRDASRFNEHFFSFLPVERTIPLYGDKNEEDSQEFKDLAFLDELFRSPEMFDELESPIMGLI